MATSANVRKVESLTYGSGLTEPVGARFSTESMIKENRPGTVITDECLAVEGIKHTAQFQYQGIATIPTPGAKHDAVSVLQTFINSTGGAGGANLTVTLPNAMFTDGDIDATRDPAVQTMNCRYVGTSLQPITVA